MRAKSLAEIVRFSLTALIVVLGATACDDGDRRPDTGFGANQSVPATVNCSDLCDRLGACAAQLCNEDTHSTRYSSLGDLLSFECQQSCTDAQLRTLVKDPQEWRCLFQSSCREAVDYNLCNAMGSYHCN